MEEKSLYDQLCYKWWVFTEDLKNSSRARELTNKGHKCVSIGETSPLQLMLVSTRKMYLFINKLIILFIIIT